MVSIDSGLPEIKVRRSSQYLNSRARRASDMAIAASLLVALAPVLALIVLAIRASSPGPVLFRQTRHGRNLQPFQILKFRSMHVAACNEKSVRQAARGDSRITAVGRLLRRTSMDELPQLINVLRGEMALIGPRPHAMEHDFHYMGLIPEYHLRFCARPGLTGLAQVSGSRGPTPTVEDMARRVTFDLTYLDQASPVFDAKLMLKTVREVIWSRTAY